MGVEYKLIDLQVTHRSDAITDILESSGFVLGSPTLNNGMPPRMADFLMYLRGSSRPTWWPRRSVPTAGRARR